MKTITCPLCGERVVMSWDGLNYFCQGCDRSGKVEAKKLSNCHQAPVELGTANEGTSYYVCSRCQKPCDLWVEAKEAKFHELPEAEQADLINRASQEAAKEQDGLLAEPSPKPIETEGELDKQLLRVRQAYTEAHSRLGGSDKSTVPERATLEQTIIEEARAEILSLIAREREAAVREAGKGLQRLRDRLADVVENNRSFETLRAKELLEGLDAWIAELKGTQPHEL